MPSMHIQGSNIDCIKLVGLSPLHGRLSSGQLAGVRRRTQLNSYLQRHNQNSHEFSAQSILNRCGYSVSRTNHLSRTERTQLLESIIAHGVLSREEVKSFINWLIRFHGANPIMDGALIEWKIDLLAIAQGRKSNVVLVKRICT